MKNFIIERIKHYANKCPKNHALIFNHESITYGELDKITDYYAMEIKQKIGNKKNAPIVIYKQRNLSFIVSIISVIKSHCYYIPFEIDTPLNRVLNICNRVKPVAIICDFCLESTNIKYKYIKIGLDVPLSKSPLLFCTKTFDDEIMDDDLLYMIFTSGTTGIPKGVKINYSNVYNLLQSLYDIVYRKFDTKVNVGVLASFNFDASVKQIFGSLFYGHTLVIADNDIKYFGRKIHQFHNEYNLSLCDCTPTHLQLMIIQKTKHVTHIPYLIVGGENLKWETLLRLRNKIGYEPVVINVYGPTECCVDVSYNYINSISNETEGNVPIGTPVRNTELYLNDENGNVITECDLIGELVVYGLQVGSGYFDGDEGNFIKDEKGCNIGYKTGDLAKYTKRNEIVIVSRKDGQIKINGNRVELEEVSSVISSYLGTSCVVLPKCSGERISLIAYIYNVKVDKMELKRYLSSIVPDYMLPSEYKVLYDWPITQNGKLDLRKIEIVNGEPL